MMNYQTICTQVAAGVKDAMQTALANNEKCMTWERYFGTAVVIVEVETRKESGWIFTHTYVTVAHEDAHHQSPRLRSAIAKALPDWDEEERRIRLRYQ